MREILDLIIFLFSELFQRLHLKYPCLIFPTERTQMPGLKGINT